MSRNKFDSLSNLHPGKYDYQIKVRVIRLWRGATLMGEEFKSFNILLLDAEKNRIHAFIPGLCAENLYSQIKLANVYSIKFFTVQPYKAADIFRCVRNENQLILSKDTKIQDMEENTSQIPEDVFDLYDHSELEALSEQKVYLADVVGIIKKHDKFRNVNTKT
ncbi:hypothetical protein POM88_012800 [Heracleum sosnowskyi]|uniref:Replication protein A 70 kDa DNA-binding subunit B/D first OB fold domain-containing protein n=1 Tax=Heracleum sosnowskyi TaxID=360622 RepID=A0AAD8IX61_9APIA|nr:hypothetical protein POM88_012800 [Heracleum sosnowskyi]